MTSLAIVIAAGQIAAAIALLNGAFTAFGQGRIAASALEAMARQPEAAGSVRGTMIVGLAIAETSAIYGLLIAFLLLFANPLIPIYLNAAGLG